MSSEERLIKLVELRNILGAFSGDALIDKLKVFFEEEFLYFDIVPESYTKVICEILETPVILNISSLWELLAFLETENLSDEQNIKLVQCMSSSFHDCTVEMTRHTICDFIARKVDLLDVSKVFYTMVDELKIPEYGAQIYVGLNILKRKNGGNDSAVYSKIRNFLDDKMRILHHYKKLSDPSRTYMDSP